MFGKLYISTNQFCFKSSGPLAARTQVSGIYLLVLSDDIEGCGF